ncbi:NADH dehydrogenase [ubiquinone] 1 alpha subcomplex subunit 7-like [Liolophura sinensis]|uniref:NADH dehydrogenase [ubiquinone] 1 alpha subcomplex subunit 7-like n=1 Tax=Liolophura sinensis TaxID=3198878 RepID=UPI0031581074
MAAKRQLTPFLAKIRDFLLWRKYNQALRFEEELSPRTQAPPVLPDGPSHKLNNNYYYTRDGRREVNPPTVVFTEGQKLVGAGQEIQGKPRTQLLPGYGYNWESGQGEYLQRKSLT